MAAEAARRAEQRHRGRFCAVSRSISGRVATELTRVLDKLKTGNTRAPSLSPGVVALAREAWLVASLDGGAARIRSGHLLVALLSDEGLSRTARESSPQLAQISAETLRRELGAICGDSAEQAADTPAEGAPAGAAAGRAPGSPALDQFTINLTERARKGEIDPVLGRDAEIRQVIDILMRRRQNNPILTGEAGVGKTAIVEGLALAIAKDEVPPPLKNVVLRTLDLGLLQAGAGVKGEFENRLKSVIEEVKASPRPIILFIDEAHTMIGAGGQAGQSDAANLLKPALARGDLRTIAATTWAEYKKYFERDAALTRRFQVVKVEEPDEKAAIDMLRGLLPTLEAHHKVRILREALVEAVRLSQRYIPARQLPDKAVSLIDTACARVAISRSATPPAVEDLQRRIETADRRHRGAASASSRPAATTRPISPPSPRRRRRPRRACGNSKRAGSASASWRKRSRALRERLAAPPPAKTDDAAERARWRERLAALDSELEEVQGEAPLLFTQVDGQAVAEVVAGWTGIPLGRMVGDEIRAVLGLRETYGGAGHRPAAGAATRSPRRSRPRARS